MVTDSHPKSAARFTNADTARKYLETLRWQDGPICVHCGVVGEATILGGKSTRPGVYWCNACQRPFSVTVGTVYESSKIPLNTWLYANHLLCGSKKDISGLQLARMLGVSYKTAWFMARHIREAMATSSSVAQP
jgi:transposase-like protein